MSRKIVSGWMYVERCFRAGQASLCIHKYDELRPGDKVMLVVCVSWRDRATKRQNNLADQERNLRRHVEARGAEVVGVHRWIGPRYDSDCVLAIVSGAKRRGAKYLLAETTDRLVRHQLFHSVKRPNLQATDGQLQEVADAADGLLLMTHLDPDATPSEVRSYQRKRGQWAKGNKGGGSKRKGYDRRYEQLPNSQRLKFRKLCQEKKRKSIRKIAALMGWSTQTTQRRVSQFGVVYRSWK